MGFYKNDKQKNKNAQSVEKPVAENAAGKNFGSNRQLRELPKVSARIIPPASQR